jgi:hypothetical protein
MARRRNKPTTVRQSLVDDARRMRRLAASPEWGKIQKQAKAVAEGLKRAMGPDFEALVEVKRAIEEDAAQDLPAPAATVTTTAAPNSAPEPTPVAPARQKRRRKGEGPQIDRALRAVSALPKTFPNGKVPRGMTGTAVKEAICNYLKDERARGEAPVDEKNLGEPSSQVVYELIKRIGTIRLG